MLNLETLWFCLAMLGICEILDQQTCLRSYERFTSICRFEGDEGKRDNKLVLA